MIRAPSWLTMVTAPDAIALIVMDLDLRAYSSNMEKRSAVERQLMILGEAVAQLMRTRRDLQPRFTSPERMIAFRNIVVHGYYMVKDDIVWEIICNHVPVLRREAETLLNEQ